MFSHNGPWVITTLGMYQTRFWINVAQQLSELGQTVVFVSFDDRSTQYLAERQFEVYAVSEDDRNQARIGIEDFESFLSEYGMVDLQYWLTHERFAFDQRNSQEMLFKLMTCLVFVERVLVEVSKRGQPLVIQELGGFISVVSSFFAARKRGIDNWFIEPSFFRGRQFFIRNQFASIEVPLRATEEVRDEVQNYLAEVKAKRIIVVPLKDKHHYSTALKKILSFHNIRRLVEKSFDKYVLGKNQEFGHIKSHVRRHFLMLLNSFKLSGSYSKLSEVDRFVYFPLHVPGDVALTLRSPEFLDQLSVVDYLARILPVGYKLAIKEHPAMIGAIDADRLKSLLRRYDQIVLIAPHENNFNVIEKCDAVISINSKSGAEAVLLDKVVFVLGDAFYRNCPFAVPVASLPEMGELLKKYLVEPKSSEPGALELYFDQVWSCTNPGELYVDDDHNTKLFVSSLVSVLGCGQNLAK